MSNLTNFGEVFAETLPPELQKTFTPTASAIEIWDAVLATHVYVLDPPMFIRIGDKKLIGREAFNGLYNPIRYYGANATRGLAAMAAMGAPA